MAQIPEELIRHFLVTYRRPPGFDNELCQAFSGIEIMRRLIGVAQLPIAPTTGFRARILARAHRALLNAETLSSKDVESWF